ncbi:MAG: radical SAM protein [Acidobacteria bacterium]|nr:MAG: radical SAM protein [Acidobacteriota bacterium]
MLPRSLSINLEPTFRCNLACEMCPRFSSEDPHLDMAAETYERICQFMSLAHTVDFTGWGEPLLHPRIFEMIRAAKTRGCVTSMTSNGTALNERNSASLLDSGLDRLAVSVDGVRAETYNAIRVGSSFDRIQVNISRLTHMIAQKNSRMELAIAYTLQECNADELNLVVPWVASVGGRVVHLKHVNAISTASDWDRSFLKYRLHPLKANNGRLEGLEAAIDGVMTKAARAGIKVMMHSEYPLTPQMRGRHCLATPLQSVYVSHDGKISPCCHLGHHVSRFFNGEPFPASSLIFGDIKSQDLEEVWESEDHRRFREAFEKANYPSACRTCYLLYGK